MSLEDLQSIVSNLTPSSALVVVNDQWYTPELVQKFYTSMQLNVKAHWTDVAFENIHLQVVQVNKDTVPDTWKEQFPILVVRDRKSHIQTMSLSKTTSSLPIPVYSEWEKSLFACIQKPYSKLWLGLFKERCPHCEPWEEQLGKRPSIPQIHLRVPKSAQEKQECSALTALHWVRTTVRTDKETEISPERIRSNGFPTMGWFWFSSLHSKWMYVVMDRFYEENKELIPIALNYVSYLQSHSLDDPLPSSLQRYTSYHQSLVPVLREMDWNGGIDNTAA